MEQIEALRIVLSLARDNIINEADDINEYNRQVEACNILEDIIVNEFGDQ